MTLIANRGFPPLAPWTHFSKNRLNTRQASNPQSDHDCFMLTELYIEALLVDEELADLVWGAWNSGLINDEFASVAWLLLAA